MWKLDEIRKRVATDEQRFTQKDAVRNYLRAKQNDFQYAVTLTFHQHFKATTEKGVHYRQVGKQDVEATAAKFKRRLNSIALGSSAKRYGNSLNYFFVVEGERSNKHLHLHLLVGGELRKIKRNEFKQAVETAAALCENVGTEIDVQVADSGWLEYITKEVGKHDTDNVLWELA
jgi:hypothetical protein